MPLDAVSVVAKKRWKSIPIAMDSEWISHRRTPIAHGKPVPVEISLDCEDCRMPGRTLLTLPGLATAEDVSPWLLGSPVPESFIVMADEDEDVDEEDDEDDDDDDDLEDDDLDDDDLDDDDFDDDELDDDFDDDDFDDDDDDFDDDDDDDEEEDEEEDEVD
jgi:hypothetical protein